MQECSRIVPGILSSFTLKYARVFCEKHYIPISQCNFEGFIADVTDYMSAVAFTTKLARSLNMFVQNGMVTCSCNTV